MIMGCNIWPKFKSNTTTSQPQKQHQQHPSITIELLESVLCDHQAHRPVLRGVVELKFQKPVAISSLRLDFHGHLEYCLVQPDVSCQKKFAECSLPLYPGSPSSAIPTSSISNPLVIQDQGDKPTKFVFEMPLPNNNNTTTTTTNNSRQTSLIQSIQCNEVKVNYQIKAVLEYHQLHDMPQCNGTYNKKRKRKSSVIHLIESPAYPIIIIQIPTYDDGNTFFTSDNMLASIDSQKQSNHWCQYRVRIDKRFAAISSKLSLSVCIAPLIHGLKLAQVSMHIVQRFTINQPTTMSSQTFSRPPIPLECQHQSTPYPSSSSKCHTGGTLYEGEFQYKIPAQSSSATTTLLNQINANGLVPSIQANAVSEFKVEHHLLVYLTFTYPKMSHDGILHRARRKFTFQCDFDLLHPCLADHTSDQFLRLPAYDSTVLSTANIVSSAKIQQQQRLAHHPHHIDRRRQSLFVAFANEFLHQSSSLPSPPIYDHAVLLPPAIL